MCCFGLEAFLFKVVSMAGLFLAKWRTAVGLATLVCSADDLHCMRMTVSLSPYRLPER